MSLRKNLLGQALACSAIALAASAASADTYDFVLTGDYSAHWQLSSSPIPDDSEEGFAFALYDVGGTFPSTGNGLVDLYFYHADLGGGIEINDFNGSGDDMVLADGAQLYTGTEDAPTFRLGTFALDGTPYDFGTYTLTITNITAVPEPDTYAMLLAGIGALGFVAARRRKA